jgi:hypothetical protein
MALPSVPATVAGCHHRDPVEQLLGVAVARERLLTEAAVDETAFLNCFVNDHLCKATLSWPSIDGCFGAPNPGGGGGTSEYFHR